jgi:molybdopterin converting factor small subunit
MKIELKLYASLKRYMPPQGGGDQGPQMTEIEEGTTIKELLEHLKVPAGAVKIIFLNGIHADVERVLKDGDRLGVFPPVAGG